MKIEKILLRIACCVRKKTRNTLRGDYFRTKIAHFICFLKLAKPKSYFCLMVRTFASSALAGHLCPLDICNSAFLRKYADYKSTSSQKN
ncbi:MAG: hypothetical protein B5M51_03050 [Anaerolinea sp. 4484_236]|nr:MAG: hypothetical protein B5M51_03050 [Anaerolinea sp. 4484_236]